MRAGFAALIVVCTALSVLGRVECALAFQGDVRGITLAPIEDSRLGAVGYGTERCAQALFEIAEIGAEWVSLTPFGRMDDLEDTEILHDFEIPADLNEEMIRKTASQARAVGLKVAVVPHIYVMSGEWRGQIDPGGSEEWERWFDSYDEFAGRFAALAQEIGADLFSIGVEFKSSTNFHEERWRTTIDKVRSLYSGPITYSANWDELDQVEFWDALDLIGVNAFWPLADRPGDGFETMTEKAGDVADELEALAVFWNRPVAMVEFGVKSARDAALAPWEWPEHCRDLVYDEPYQAAAYRAVFEQIGSRPWFKGLFIWKYFSDPYDISQEERAGFSPKGKLAEDVLSDWFASDWSTLDLDL